MIDTDAFLGCLQRNLCSDCTMTDPVPEFKKFLSTCSSLLKGESPQFLGLIRKRYDSCSETFRTSSHMVDLLSSTTSKMLSDQKRFFVHLKDFVNELKAWSVEGQAKASRKRKSESPRESLAKVAKIEDSTSEGSDLEGKLHRALESGGQSSSIQTTSAVGEPVTHQPALSCELSETTEQDCAESEAKPVPATTTCVATDSDSPTVSTDVVAVTEAERTETLTNNGSGSHDEMPTIPPQVAADHCSSNPDSGLSLNTPSSGGLPSSSSPKLNSFENEHQDVVNVRGETTNSQANGSREVCDKVNSDPGCLTADGEFGDSTCKSEDVKCSVTSTHVSEPVASRSQEAGAICCVKAPPAPDSSTSLEAASPHNKGKSLGDAIKRLKTKLISLPPTAATKLPSPKTINGEAVDDSKKPLVKDSKDSLVDDRHSENRRKSKIVSKVSSKRPEPSTSSGGNGEHAHSRSKEPEAEEEVEGGGKESKYVKRLERLLEKIRDEIEKVRERDLSLDDLDAEDSAYIYEDRLQKKFMKVWERLCKTRGSSTASGRPVERKFKYQGTRFPEINRKIEKFVNRPNTFPDYHDIRGIIKKVNTRCHLGLNVMQINSISKETFMDVGEALQRRRKADFISTFHSKQTLPCSNEEDPAMFDSELRIKLEQNQQIGRTRLEGVIRKYTDLQLALGDVDKDEIEREASSTNCSLKSRADPHAKSLSDHRYKSPSRPRSESPSDRQRKSPSRPGSNSPLDNLSKSPSDHRSKSPSVGWSKSPSDYRSKSPSISRSKSPSDHRSKSPSISRSKSPSVSRSKSPSVSRSKSPSVSRSKSPSISRSKSPSMSRSKSPSVSRSKSPSDHDLNLAIGQFSNAPSIDDEELNEELNDETEEQARSQVMKKAKVVLMDCMKEEEEEEEDMEEDDDDAEEEEEVEEEDVEEEEEDMDEDVEDEMSMIEMDIAEECHLLMGDDSQDDSDWQHQPGNSATSWQPEGGNTASWQGDYDDSVSEWPELAGERVIEPSGCDVSHSAVPNDDRNNVSEVAGDGSVRLLDPEGAESQSEWGEEEGGSCAQLLESPRQVSETLPEQSENKERTSQPEGSGGKLGREGQVGVGWREEEGDSPTVWIEENEDSCEQPQNASTPPSASVDRSSPCVGADRTAGSATTSGVEHRLAAGEDIVNAGGKRGRRLEDLQQDEVQEREMTEVYEDRCGNSAGSDGVKIEVDVDRGEDAGSGSALGRSDCSAAQNRSPGVFFQSDVIDLDAGSLDTDKEGVVETDGDSRVVGEGREGVRTVQGGDSVGVVEQTRHNCVEKDGQNSATKHSQDDVISHSVIDNGGDTLQAAGSDQSPCSISRTHSPNTVSSLKTGSLHLIKKSNSPVKINPDLRLPAYLQQRNSEACTSKTDAVFYPDRMAPSYAFSEQNGDSITIGSSDEETDVKPDVKPTVCAKTEPKSTAGPDDGEVIVLSDDD